jgi:cytochrome b561
MRARFWWVLCFAVLSSGCVRVYQSDRSVRAIHISGIGWIMESTATNKIRVFGLGFLDATSIQTRTTTNSMTDHPPVNTPP